MKFNIKILPQKIKTYFFFSLFMCNKCYLQCKGPEILYRQEHLILELFRNGLSIVV
jgi:hypothetical protein